MTRILSFLIIMLGVTSLLGPVTLWIYQVAQFGGWNFDLGRMSADRIASTCAKAFLFSMIISVLVANLRKVREFLLRLNHWAAKV